ncbi:TetR family transcriptional regulator [Paracoccus sp. SSJ]|uniref:TetR/AcrR family transcriptional regulator n=1 Tax=Paracoccus sp. SSJ TaxID=3050636 RepID=UPI00254C40E5|nr:TetR family transcriptional regulator [Paracoccus sp. SSJ]MDK8871071.1 TetR family transcriptional regulator [Paracoccus sp. SSJ]
MGRSSAEQAQRNRAKVVECASRLFRARGVEAVSVADIMAAAGMTVGGFYKHFASKEALAREACALSFAQADESWQGFPAHAESRQDSGISAIVRHYFRERPAHLTCPMLAYAPHLSGGETAVPAQDAYGEGVEKLLAGFLDRAGEGTDAPERLRNARIIFAAMIGAKLLAQASGNAGWARSLQDAVAEGAGGLCPEGQSASGTS